MTFHIIEKKLHITYRNTRTSSIKKTPNNTTFPKRQSSQNTRLKSCSNNNNNDNRKEQWRKLANAGRRLLCCKTPTTTLNNRCRKKAIHFFPFAGQIAFALRKPAIFAGREVRRNSPHPLSYRSPSRVIETWIVFRRKSSTAPSCVGIPIRKFNVNEVVKNAIRGMLVGYMCTFLGLVKVVGCFGFVRKWWSSDLFNFVVIMIWKDVKIYANLHLWFFLLNIYDLICKCEILQLRLR